MARVRDNLFGWTGVWDAEETFPRQISKLLWHWKLDTCATQLHCWMSIDMSTACNSELVILPYSTFFKPLATLFGKLVILHYPTFFKLLHLSSPLCYVISHMISANLRGPPCRVVLWMCVPASSAPPLLFHSHVLNDFAESFVSG